MPYGSSLRPTRPSSIAVVMAIIAAGTLGVWYWRSIVKQRLPDWTWSKTGAGLVPDRMPESDFQQPPYLPRGDLMAVNKGPGPSNLLRVKFFLSRDNKLSADDKEGGWTELVLNGEREVHYNNPLMVPLDRNPPGVYYIILVLDPFHQIAETEEGNNAIALRFESCKGRQC